MQSHGPELIHNPSPESRYGQFIELCKKTQGVVYTEAQRMLRDKPALLKQLRKPPAYLICPTDVFIDHMKQLALAGAVETGQRGVDLVPEQAEIMWVPYANVLVIPERLVSMSQDPDMLFQMDAKMKLTEDLIHAVTTVEDPVSHQLRTGFTLNVGMPEEGGWESGKFYHTDTIPLPIPSAQTKDTVEKEQITRTESATTITTNMLFSKICGIPTYTRMQFDLQKGFTETEVDISIKTHKLQLEKIFESLFTGNLELLDGLSMQGNKRMLMIRNNRLMGKNESTGSVDLRTIVTSLYACRLLSVAPTGRDVLDVYSYRALRTKKNTSSE